MVRTWVVSDGWVALRERICFVVPRGESDRSLPPVYSTGKLSVWIRLTLTHARLWPPRPAPHATCHVPLATCHHRRMPRAAPSLAPCARPCGPRATRLSRRGSRQESRAPRVTRLALLAISAKGQGPCPQAKWAPNRSASRHAPRDTNARARHAPLALRRAPRDSHRAPLATRVGRQRAR